MTMPSTTPEEMDPIESELQKIITTDRELVTHIDLLKSMAKELADRKGEMHNNTISARKAERIEQTLDELEIELVRQFEKVLDSVAVKSTDSDAFVSIISELLCDIDTIRYSAIDGLFPKCPHCEANKMSVEEFAEMISPEMASVSVLSEEDAEYVAAKKAIISFYLERAELYTEVSGTHLPAEYQGYDVKEVVHKIGELAIRVSVVAAGTLIGLQIYDAVKR